MTTYTITTPQNITALTAKTGGDIYNINGGSLTIDTDSRYGLNQAPNTSIGSIVLSASLGGVLSIDSTRVRLIPFNTGTGNVPVGETVISQGGVTGYLIGVWSAINVAPIASGSAMPATGFIKVRAVNVIGGYASGALTGIGASATEADVAGWIEIVGDDGGFITTSYLSSCNFLGDWFEIGVTSGSNATVYQLPTSGNVTYVGGVWVETATGSGVYEKYHGMGNRVVSASVGTEPERGKVCWVEYATGRLRFGHDGTNSNTGYTPPAGRRIRIPNILLTGCTTAARTVNQANTTIASRFKFTIDVPGNVSIDKVCSIWYGAFSKLNALSIANSALQDTISISNLASSVSVSNIISSSTLSVASAFLISNPLSGGLVDDCIFVTPTTATVLILTAGNDITVSNCKLVALTPRSASNNYSLLLQYTSVATIINCTFINTGMHVTQSNNITIKDCIFASALTGIATTTAGQPITLSFVSRDILIEGLSWLPLNNMQFYTCLLAIILTAPGNVIFRNVGSFAAPLNMGTVNACACIVTQASDVYATRISLSRIYTVNARTTVVMGATIALNSSYVNLRSDYADTYSIRGSNNVVKGIIGTPDLTAAANVVGCHWTDAFVSTTVGRLCILMNLPSIASSSQVALANGASFTGLGTLYMPVIGQQAIFELPYYCIGHLSFANTLPVMTGGTLGNYTVSFDIDKNDGNGFSNSYTIATAANLAAVTGIDAAKGFKLRVKIVTIATNTGTISSLYFVTDSNTTVQTYQYVLSKVTIQFLGIPIDTEIRIYNSGGTLLTGIESSGIDPLLSWESDITEVVRIVIVNIGCKIQDFTYQTVLGNQSIPISLVPDPWYSNP